MTPTEPGPPSKTVILAVDVVSGSGVSEDAHQSVKHAVIGVVGFTAELQFGVSNNDIPVLAVFKSNAPLTVLLPALVEKLDGLDRTYGIRTHLLLHYGMVFTQMSRGNVVYVGSALQTARRYLRTLTNPESSRLATRDFARSDKAPGLGFRGNDNDALAILDFSRRSAQAKQNNPLLTPSQVQSITPLLAQHIGPLALALVKDLSRRSSSLAILVQNLGREIDDSTSRKRFEADVWMILKGSNEKGRGNTRSGV